MQKCPDRGTQTLQSKRLFGTPNKWGGTSRFRTGMPGEGFTVQSILGRVASSVSGQPQEIQRAMRDRSENEWICVRIRLTLFATQRGSQNHE
jgi:hypothetical protein